MHFRKHPRLALTPLLLALALGACDDDDGVDVPTPAERADDIRTLVEVGQGNPSRIVRAGHGVRVVARVTDRLDLPVEGAPVVWSGNGSFAADAATTGFDGLIAGTWTAGTSAGVQELVATVDGNSDVFDRTTIFVFPDTVVGTLVLDAVRDTVARGDSTRVIVVEARDRYGNPYALAGSQPDSPPAIEFTTLDPSVATLRATTARTALVSALAAGTARIVARSDGKADTVAVTVTP